MLAGLGALLFSAAGSANAQPAPAPGPRPGPTPGPAPGSAPPYVPASVLDRVTAVLATNDPKLIRAEAARLRKEGWTLSAIGLEGAAATLEALQGQTPAPAPSPAPGPAPAPAPTPYTPPYVPAVNPVPVPVPVRPPAVPVVFVPPASGVPAELAGVTLHRMAAPEPYDHRVVLWQDRLKVLKFRASTTKSDGKFGPNVESQTKSLQKAKGLTQTGIADAATINAAWGITSVSPVPLPARPIPQPAQISPLNVDVSTWRAVMSNGSVGEDVKQWRSVLLRDGFTTTTPDTTFGPSTEASTKAWQTAHGLFPDGKVGKDVKAKLVGISPLPTVVAGAFALLTVSEPYVADAPPLPLLELVPALAHDEQPAEPSMQDLARQLAEHIAATPEGQEDRARIEEFQRRCGLNATGSYGPATGEAIAFFGSIPPRPRAWPTKKLYRSQTRYRIAMREHAARDPDRAAEWLAAASG